MATILSNPKIVTSNTDPAPTNMTVIPASGSDGTYIWRCVGQKNTGATSTMTFSVIGIANSASIVAGTTNQLKASCQVSPTSTNYVQVTASYTAPSNSQNWTIIIGATGSSGSVRFARGAGGGAARKPAPAKKAVKKAAKPARKAAKPAKKATKPVKKAAPKAAKKKVAAKRRK